MSHSSVHRRVMAATIVFGLAAAGGLLAAGPAAAAGSSRSAAKLSSQSLFASTAVTSSTHKKLAMTLSVSKPAKGSATLTVSLSQRTESHSWSLMVARTSFALSSKQAGHVKVSSASTHGFAALDLTFTRHGKVSKTSCSSANYSSQATVDVEGSVHFSTKSTGSGSWGVVSVAATKKKPLKASATSTYGTGAACLRYKTPCAASTAWNLFGSGSVQTYIGGGSDHSKGFIIAFKNVALGNYGSREDSTFLSAPKPTLTGSGATATYTVTTGSGQAHGSLTFAANTAPSSFPTTCYKNKVKSSETVSSYNADVTSHNFAITEQIFGPFTVPDDGAFTSTR